MRNQENVRIRLLTVVIGLIVSIIVLRLYFLQIQNHDSFVVQANEQYVHTVQDIFNRGEIFFTNKDGDLLTAAGVKAGYKLALNPKEIEDPGSVYDAIFSYLDIDKDTFIHRATLPDRVYVEVANNITEEEGEEIISLNLPGVRLYRTQWRYYPGENIASRTVGFMGYSSDESEKRTGMYGLERSYEEVLKRENESLSVNFFAEIFTNLGELIKQDKSDSKGDVVTTIEPSVSRMLQRVLTETHEEYDASETGGIVMDPQTGAIFALESVPTYDNNDRSGVPLEHFQNPLVENVYEFGSIFKPLTVAAGLDSQTITPQTTYFDAGSLSLDGYTIHNYDGRGRGEVTMQEVLDQSLNTGVSYIVDKMRTQKFREYLIDYGIASSTNIRLPNEAEPLTSNLSSPRKVEYATASFGQGLAITPVSMVRALSTLANGGYLVNPHVVQGIKYPLTFKEGEWTKEKGDRIFNESTSETISRMLTKVVDDALAGGTVALPHHTIAAKTGTAQMANPAGGYYEDRFLHSFFGYFPAYDPRFIILLYTVEPKNVDYASQTLTSPFMKTAEFLINYYDIPPDR